MTTEKFFSIFLEGEMTEGITVIINKKINQAKIWMTYNLIERDHS